MLIIKTQYFNNAISIIHPSGLIPAKQPRRHPSSLIRLLPEKNKYISLSNIFTATTVVVSHRKPYLLYKSQ